MMPRILRHLLSILLLPFMVVVVVPYWLLTVFTAGDNYWLHSSPITWMSCSAGSVLMIVGLALFSWCVSLFATIGHGTLAPWDPTRNLVTIGPYRFIRNPMISGVAIILLGQALFWNSLEVGIWAGIFFCINHMYFILSEEPGLEKRFGEPYRIYKANVPRWIPRLRSWSVK